PISVQLQRVCHDTLPWLISFSLDPKAAHGANRSSLGCATDARYELGLLHPHPFRFSALATCSSGRTRNGVLRHIICSCRGGCCIPRRSISPSSVARADFLGVTHGWLFLWAASYRRSRLRRRISLRARCSGSSHTGYSRLLVHVHVDTAGQHRH